uniref:RNase H type-1 domain-containing protein n=1 Tax=Davidia involucrata TaxID=16924 RepID=A0A5B7BZL4_DAVIN
MTWWETLLDRWKDMSNRDNLVRIATFLLWHIWKVRNQVVFKGVPTNPLRTVSMAQHGALEFAAAMESISSNNSLHVSHLDLDGWIPPDFPLLKLNVDGAWRAVLQGGGVGALIQNESGEFIAGFSKCLMHVGFAQMMEAYALLEGLLFCKANGIRNMVVESDNKELIQLLQSSSSFPPEFEVLLCDVLSIGKDLGVVEFRKVRRSGNKPAYALAQASYNVVDVMTWMEDPPGWLCSILQHDRAGL